MFKRHLDQEFIPHIYQTRFIKLLVTVILSIGVIIGVGALKTTKAYADFTFTAAGDQGITAYSKASFAAIPGTGSSFSLALGDMSYNGLNTEQSWCDLVHSYVGATYPYELIGGNHEADTGPDGRISKFTACMPNHMSNIVGTYGKEYYFDYPQATPLGRFIEIGASVTFDGVNYSYTAGSAHYKWLSDAIDSARTAKVPWVVVSMHKPCLSLGSKQCEIGKDLMDLLISKKVDLVLTGHDHVYQRSKQLTCASLTSSTGAEVYTPSCVADNGADDNYTKGAGSVWVTQGEFGGGAFTNYQTLQNPDPGKDYFAKFMGGSGWFDFNKGTSGAGVGRGFVKYSMTPTSLTGTVLYTTITNAATPRFADTFSITGSGTTTPPPPPPAGDTTVPTVSISAPTSGATVTGSVNITAAASDNIGVTKVDILIDGAVVKTLTATPYTFAWDSKTVANGQHSIQARAFDAAGNQGNSSIVNVTVSTSCSAPANPIGSAVYTINAASSGPYKAWVRIMAPDTTNNSLYLTSGTTCNAVLGDTTNIPAKTWTWVNSNPTATVSVNLISGNNTVTVYGRENGVLLDKILFINTTCVPTGNGDNCTQASDTTPPLISLSSPTPNQSVTGTLAVAASASDPETGIAKVEFYVDTLLLSSDTAAPYSYNLDTTTLTPGTRSIIARAYNGAGLVTSVTVNVTVKDVTKPVVSITDPKAAANVAGSVPIVLNATDNKDLAKAEILVDGTIIQTLTGTGPYSITWDTRSVAVGAHSITAKAYDSAGNVGVSAAVSVNVINDTAAPSIPSGLTATASSSTQINVNWSASTDNTAVIGYRVKRNGLIVADVKDGTSTYTDSTAVASTTYQYTVSAYDAIPNISADSAAVSVTTPALATDTTPPTAPANLTATAVSSSQINLAWSASTDDATGIKEYRVYRVNTLIATVHTTSYGDTGLTANTSYTYHVNAVDGAGNVSTQSLTATATTNANTTISKLTININEDTYADATTPTTTFGTRTIFNIDASPTQQSYLKFNVSGINGRQVVSAKLRLKVSNQSPYGGTFYSTSPNWSETKLDWNNKPAVISKVGSIGNAPDETFVEVDLTSLITADGTYALAVRTSNADGVHYYSSESVSANRPQVIVSVR